MRKRFLFGLLGLLTLLPTTLSAEDEVVNMPQFGKQVVEVASGQTITFYDMNGESNVSGSSNNSCATIIFKPATEGEAVMINFEYVDVRNDGTSYPAKFLVYEGVFDTTSITYPTQTSEVGTTIPFPENEQTLAALDGTYENLSYYSTDPTGALSCCYYYRWAKTCKGWKATVSTIVLTDMEVLGAATDYSLVETDIYPGKSHVGLGGFSITTEGVAHPDVLTSVSFTLTGGGIYDPSNLRLYQGNAANTSTLAPVETTLSEADGVYTFILSKTLTSGDNTFCIGGDVLESAPFNSTSTLTITAIRTANGYNTLTTSDPVVQTVQPIVLMSQGEKSITIGQRMTIYDDGGAEGNISNNFEGTLTLLPASDGKKVKLDMRNIHIFYTSSAVSLDNQDILSIYNGQGKTNLLYTVTTDKLDSLVFTSTAEDGALTIYLRSKTPTSYYIGSGFVATAEEVTPEPMVVGRSTIEKTTGTVAAGAAGQQLLHFCLITTNTEPALQPTAFRLATNGTFGQLDHLRLYYTGFSETLSTLTKVAEADVEGETVSLVPTADFTLREGPNHFFLLADIVSTAQTGQSIDVSLSGIDFDGSETYSDFGTQEGGLTIRNTAYSSCGSQTISLYGAWEFTHTRASEYSEYYKAENCDQTTTFLPTTDGCIVEMDFADFAVYYSTSYSGIRATFKIYAGSDTNGELLWEANADNKSTGPGKIRSTSADGALTVLFNPNTSSGYNAKGWHATVQEYLPKPMQVETTALSLPEQQVSLVRDLKHTPLLELDITTSGMLEPLAFSTLTIGLENCAAALDSLLLMQGGEVVAKAKVAEDAAEVTLSLEGYTLSEGGNTFTIAANIAADAPFGTEVSLSSVQLGIGEETLLPEVPANARPVVNIYCLETEWRKVEVGETPLTFYDAGGPEGKLTSSAKGAVTFVPTVPNTAIQLRFIQWDINGADNFYIYYADTVQTQYDLSPSYYTTDILDWEVVSEAESGALTVKFSGGFNSYLHNGWEIEVSCHTLTELKLDSVVITNASAGVVTKGSEDVSMLRVAVSTSGDRGNVQVEAFTLSDLPEGVSPVYYSTGSGTIFATTAPFDATAPITRKGTYYYWVALNLASDLAEGTYTLTCPSVQIDGTEVTPLRTATASLQVISGMHGEYRIGSSDEADFISIQSAVDALSIGIDGPVTFLIESGTYEECVRIPELMGLSSTNTLTIQALTGNRDDVRIHYENYTSVYGSEYGVFSIMGADYVTLRHLTIYTGNGSFGGVVFLGNMSRNVTVDDCHIYGPTISTEVLNTMKLPLVKLLAGSEDNTNNDYFTLSNSLLENGYIGLYLGGTSNASLTHQVGGVVTGNTLVNQSNQGIYVTGERGVTIQGNRIYNTGPAKADFKAMDLLLYEGGEISGNYIYLDLDNYAEGFYMRNVYNDSEETTTRLFNNAVYVSSSKSSTSTSYGINLTKEAQYLEVAHNTFYTVSNYAVPMLARVAPKQLKVNNNIFYNAGTNLAFQVSISSTTEFAFNRNLLYTAGTTLARRSGTDIETLSDWETTIGDATAISETVAFRDSTLVPTAAGNLQSGVALPYITTDLLGTARSTTAPTLGAYEYIGGPSTDMEDASEGQEGRTGTAVKIVRDGQVLILRDGKTYNLLGARVE